MSITTEEFINSIKTTLNSCKPRRKDITVALSVHSPDYPTEHVHMTITYLGDYDKINYDIFVNHLNDLLKHLKTLKSFKLQVIKSDKFGPEDCLNPISVLLVDFDQDLKDLLVLLHQSSGVPEPGFPEKRLIPNFHVTVARLPSLVDNLNAELYVTGLKIKFLGPVDPFFELKLTN